MECGHLASPVSAEYMGDIEPNWQKAIGVGVWDGRKWFLQLVLIQDNELAFGDKIWKL
jgi:hypothetical protein